VCVWGRQMDQQVHEILIKRWMESSSDAAKQHFNIWVSWLLNTNCVLGGEKG